MTHCIDANERRDQELRCNELADEHNKFKESHEKFKQEAAE